ncbi:MAG: 50S ribosomal protein L25 [bacterium]|nr:50S ribosomal protein L25 [bacterium]
MAILKLTAVPREHSGSHSSQKLRKEGYIPVSLYSGGEPPTLLSIEQNKWGKHITEHLNLVNIQFEAGGEQVAAVREIQRDPLSQDVIHVDFFKVRMDQETEFHVAIRFDGIPQGVKDGGVRTVTSEFIQVECLPTIVPDEIPLDISGLEIGHALNARDVILPAGLKLVSDPDLTIISITTVRAVIEEVKPVEGEVVEGAEGAEGDETKAKAKGDEGDTKKAGGDQKKSSGDDKKKSGGDDKKSKGK